MDMQKLHHQQEMQRILQRQQDEADAQSRTREAELRADYLQRLEGKSVQMLVEQISPEGVASGTTDRYVQARTVCASFKPGELVRVVVDRSDGECLWASV